MNWRPKLFRIRAGQQNSPK